MIKRSASLNQQHLQYEIRDFFLPDKIGKHALIWEKYQIIIILYRRALSVWAAN